MVKKQMILVGPEHIIAKLAQDLWDQVVAQNKTELELELVSFKPNGPGFNIYMDFKAETPQ